MSDDDLFGTMPSSDILQATVTPGPCPDTGCPPTTEVVCVKVAKVFDTCASTDMIVVSAATHGALGATDNVTFDCTVTAGTPSVGATPPDFAGCVDVLVTIPFTVTFTPSSGAATVIPVTGICTHIATLYAPTGTTLQVDATVVCSPPVLTRPVVDGFGPQTGGTGLTTVISCCVVITSEVTVQLLLPSYGFCEIPQCGAKGVLCPPLNPLQINPSPCR